MNVTWEFADNKTTIEEIFVVGQSLNVVFPDDYVLVACDNHGGTPTPDTYDVDDHGEAVFGYLLSFNSNRAHYIIKTFENVKDRLLDGIIPIANDPFGNLICFDFRQDSKNPTVVFWDHEIAFSSPRDAISFISNSFTELMNKLYEYEYDSTRPLSSI